MNPPGSLRGLDGDRVEPVFFGRPTPSCNEQEVIRRRKALEDLRASVVLLPAAFEEAAAKLDELVSGPVASSPTVPDIPPGQPTPAVPVLWLSQCAHVRESQTG